MKKLILLSIVFIACISLKGQVFVQMETGVSSKKAGVAGLHVGYSGPVIVQGGYLVHLSNRVSKPAIFNVRAGKGFKMGESGQVEMLVGYASRIGSMDVKEANSRGMIYSVYYSREFGLGSWLAGVNYSGNILIAGVGLRYNF